MTVPKYVAVTPMVDSSIELQSDFSIVVSRDELVRAIYPGQPFGVRWHYAGLLGNLNAGATVSASVLSGNKLAELAKATVTYLSGGISGEIVGVSTKESSVYQIGNHNALILQAGIASIPASLDESSTIYAVVAEDFARGLVWNVTGGSSEYRVTTFAWKEAYTLAATFTNISQWVALSGTATLMEAESISGPWKARGTVAVQVSAGRTTSLVFPERKQEWGWLAPSIWIIYGSTYKGFTYAIEFNLADNFGNTYNFRGPNIGVAVAVSTRKFAFAVAAMAAMAIALILYLVSWLITPAPAGAVQAVATGLGSAALDPPKPSSKFRDQVSLPQRVLRSLGPRLELLAVAITEASLCARLDKALYQIESRFLGAIQAKDTSAEKLQRGCYGDATRLMSLTAGKLSVAVDEAQYWLRTQKDIDEAEVRQTLARWSRKGIERGTGDGSGGFDAQTFEVVGELVRSRELVALAMEGIESNLVRLRSALLDAAAYCVRDRTRLDRATKLAPRDSNL